MRQDEFKSRFEDDPKTAAIIDYLTLMQIRFGSIGTVLQKEGVFSSEAYEREYEAAYTQFERHRRLTLLFLERLLEQRDATLAEKLRIFDSGSAPDS